MPGFSEVSNECPVCSPRSVHHSWSEALRLPALKFPAVLSFLVAVLRRASVVLLGTQQLNGI